MSDYEKFRELTVKLGSPQNGLRCVHVAGTNGKGSTCAFIYSILYEAGFRNVGLYISPHLERETERISINSDEILQDDYNRLKKLVVETWEKNFDGELGYFACITAIAFLYFRERGCDYVVLEVGLGGRYDATNVIDTPVCSVITRIGLDHMEQLGDTLEKIAIEKSMIIKPNAPVVFTAQSPTVEKVFIERAERLGVEWQRAEKLDPNSVKLGLRGFYQYENAANAKSAAIIMGLDEQAIQHGLANAVWSGRYEVYEIYSSGLTVIIDGGHNANGVDALVDSLKTDYPNRSFTFIYNVRADKDLAEMLRGVEPISERLIKVSHSARDALNSAIETARRGDIICIFGTLYQVAELKKFLEDEIHATKN